MLQPIHADTDREKTRFTGFPFAHVRRPGGAVMSNTGAVRGYRYQLRAARCSGAVLAATPVYLGVMPVIRDRSPFGASRLAVWAIKHVVAPVHRWLYRAAGGGMFRLGSLNRSILLLTTTGRKTGKPRTTPVFLLPDSGGFVVCNVKPGSERTNPWVLNLRASPAATVQSVRM